MFLISLLIECKTHVIRNISFHKGMNFIVDESKESESSIKKSGNNIGKTTVLRLINYCLGSNESNIYQSKEFKNNVNETIKSFLTEQEVKVTLILRENFDDPFSRQVKLCRNFLSGTKKILEIDDLPVLAKDYDIELKKKIFCFDGDKPTFKQLKAKNIRDEAERLENTIRVLGNFGKLEEYEALYLFWLGIDYPNAERKRRLLEEHGIEEKIYKRLINENSESKIKQFISIINRDIESLEEKKKNFNINSDYESDLDLLNKTRTRLNSSYSKQSLLNLRKELIIESCEELEKNRTDLQVEILSEIYHQAELLIPNLHKTFAETVEFHNQMVQEKMRFVAEELPSIEEQIKKLSFDIMSDLAEESRLVDRLQKSDAVEEIQNTVTQLNSKYEQRGRLEEKSNQLDRKSTRLNSSHH